MQTIIIFKRCLYFFYLEIRLEPIKCEYVQNKYIYAFTHITTELSQSQVIQVVRIDEGVGETIGEIHASILYYLPTHIS